MTPFIYSMFMWIKRKRKNKCLEIIWKYFLYNNSLSVDAEMLGMTDGMALSNSAHFNFRFYQCGLIIYDCCGYLISQRGELTRQKVELDDTALLTTMSRAITFPRGTLPTLILFKLKQAVMSLEHLFYLFMVLSKQNFICTRRVFRMLICNSDFSRTTRIMRIGAREKK